MGIFMRNSLITKKEAMKALYPYFKENKNMVLLVGDMGFAVLDEYFKNFPNRVFNVGICEQATIGMAAGMAMSGLIPLVYSQIPFLVMRAYEQIRYDLNEHKLNVKLIGVGADNYFEKLGNSHCLGKDDIYMMRIFKNFKLFSPTLDSLEKDIQEIISYSGPTYLRCL